MHPDELMTELGSLWDKIHKIKCVNRIPDKDFIIHVLNNLTEKYDVVLDGM